MRIQGKTFLLDWVLVLPDRHTVNKLDSTPQSVKLGAFVYVHDAVAWRLTMPNRVLHKSFNPGEHNLKHGESAAQPLSGKEVTLGGYVCLLWINKHSNNITWDHYGPLGCGGGAAWSAYLRGAQLADDGNHLQRRVLGLQSLHQSLQLLLLLLAVISLCWGQTNRE